MQGSLSARWTPGQQDTLKNGLCQFLKTPPVVPLRMIDEPEGQTGTPALLRKLSSVSFGGNKVTSQMILLRCYKCVKRIQH